MSRAENLAADHLSRLENLDLGTFTEEEITDEFPDEHLMILKAELNSDEPWYADYANYIVGKFVPPNWTPKKRRRFFSQVKNYFWDEPCAFKLYSDNVMRRCVTGNEILEILAHCYSGPTGDIIVRQFTRKEKSMNLDSIGRASLKMLMIMGIGLWGKVRDSCRGVLGRWYGVENSGRVWRERSSTVFINILLVLPGPSDGLRLHSIVFFSSGSGLTADSSVLTLTLAFLDFGLDFAQSFPFHAQFCHFDLDAVEYIRLELCTSLIGSEKSKELPPRNRSRIGINKWYQSFALRNFDLEDIEFESTNSGTTAKLPILKLGEYEMWVIRIKQYFQIQDYALWEVIENGDSWVSIPQTA
ncbi:hypothetical protein Tco_0860382 [Tanacetum coccineum]|uniref:Reverse transcriptase n=1 Tax=Tanacetum coccineum TaxID=301880 RepID=A0ABQ5BER9_9ASTR